MKRVNYLFFIFMCASRFILSHDDISQWYYISFDQAMRLDEFPKACISTESIFGISGYALYAFFKNLYEKNNPSVVMSQSELKIPKIIHQIWLGSPVPDVFEPLMASWVRNHVGREWKYKLWTDEDVKNMNLYNQEFYDTTDNYGVKSDILRFEIIYHYGGVYVDMDYECLAPLDILHYTYDFYTALQPLDTFFVQLGSALFGAKPRHPIVKQCIERVKDSWHEKGAPKKTRPVHFTKVFYASADQEGNVDIAFPAFYFYPFGSCDKTVDRGGWRKNGAFAVHWWAKSWMPKKFRSSTFKTIDNEISVQNWNS